MAILGVAACGTPPVPQGINDPAEETNRQVHEFNKSLDRAVIRPVSNAYGQTVPEPVRRSLSNVSDNLSTPSSIINNFLQGNVGDGMHNTLRFLVNSTVGVAGLFDVATPAGLEHRRADFGQTLFVWGMPEGQYAELPLLGPSTDRDTAGKVVDLVLDPFGALLPTNGSPVRLTFRALGGMDARYRYGTTIDSVYYDSADSYSALRLYYLENRRFTLGQQQEEADPFADPFGEADPYANPYGQ